MINRYLYDEWSIVEENFCVENNYINETIFSIGNGYLGIRGNFEEGYYGPKNTGLEGTYLNGFYENEIIKYGEVAYGYAEKSQTMVNVTNSKIIKIFVEDEEFNMLEGEIENYKRTLNLKEGIVYRTLIWKSSEGKSIKIEIERLASFENKNLLAINYKITPLNFNGKIKIVSTIDGNITNAVTENDPRVGSGLKGRVLSVENKTNDGNFIALTQTTKNSKLTLACAAEHEIITGNEYIVSTRSEELSLSIEYEIEAIKNIPVVLNKYIAYTTSREYEKNVLIDKTKEILKEVMVKGYEEIKIAQNEYLKDFWYKADIKIEGDIALQQGIRFNMYHLLQSVGTDGKTNIAAKGLSGEGYEGHYFWDTEMYMFPFFLYNTPEISRKLLEYRYNILPQARERALQMGHSKGAVFPWRTINGEECSAYYPAGTAQYHINADIAFAIKRYIDVTQDTEFLLNYGAEILFETARFWVDLGDFIENKENKFCINCVTGPDEYTALVNNNFYTNLMAKENLDYAYEVANWIKENSKKTYEGLVKKIDLKDDEIALWKKAGDSMFLPYNEKLKIYEQDDTFLSKKVWDFKNTPKENYPLLIHYHPLVIYRYQVCKQADTVLAEFLLSHRFTREQKKRDYDFYELITTHDSSLSMCIFSVMANEVGYYKKAYNYFNKTARMDLDNIQGNTKDGIHAANMAGTWMAIVNGFGGMRTHDGVLSFAPTLPEKWNSYTFKVGYKGRLINIAVDKYSCEYKLLEGKDIKIISNGEEIILTK